MRTSAELVVEVMMDLGSGSCRPTHVPVGHGRHVDSYVPGARYSHSFDVSACPAVCVRMRVYFVRGVYGGGRRV